MMAFFHGEQLLWYLSFFLLLILAAIILTVVYVRKRFRK